MSVRYRLAAYAELFAHYASVIAHFWRQRRTLGSQTLKEQEAEFLPAALSLQERPVSPGARWTARTLIVIAISTLLWSLFGRVDIIVNSSGKVIPSGRSKTIASIDLASVRAVRVVEGQRVTAGEVLVELDSTATDVEHDKAIGSQSEAVLQKARARAMIAGIDVGKPPTLPSVDVLRVTERVLISDDQWHAELLHLHGLYADYLAKLKRIDGNISRFVRSLPLVTERANDYKELLKTHDVANHAWLEKEQARIELEEELKDAQNQREALVAETRRICSDQVVDADRIIASSREDATRSGAHSKLLTLRAPIDGTVQQLAVHTVGGVVQAAQPLMQIIPSEKSIEVESILENKDMGFVREGQFAEVKVDAFDYSKYGTIPARVTHVSRDAIQDEKKGLVYTNKVTLLRPTIVIDGTSVHLSPGMTVNVSIKTGERRIIEYVLSPLIQHQREALHER